jgi:ABC-type Fe3+-hydroxamate transport system substrate-binding protein
MNDRLVLAESPVSPDRGNRAFSFLALAFLVAAEPARHSAQRIVSVVPSVTELIVALGATDRFSARTAYDDDSFLREPPTLGRTMQPSAEAILALQEERRRALLWNQPGERPTAIYLIWPNPARIAGGGTYIDEVLQLAGARNAFADLGGWPQVTIESIVDRDPDYVVVPAGRTQFSSTALQKLPGWRDLVAVRNGRAIEGPAELMKRPGRRVFDGAELLRRLLQQGESAR